MNILFITGRTPYPLDEGAPIRNFHLLQGISAQHRVYLLTLCSKPPGAAVLSELRKYCAEIICIPYPRTLRRKLIDLSTSAISGMPYTVKANTSRELRAEIKRIVADRAIDLIQVEELYMAQNVLALKNLPPFVLDAHNCEKLILSRSGSVERSPLKRWFALHQARLMESFEQRAVKAAAAVFTVSDLEQQYFEGLAKVVKLVPNGVSRRPPPEREREQSLLFVGTLNYPPNRDAARLLLEQIWPQLALANPGLRLKIVGRTPPKELLRFRGNRVQFLKDVAEIEPLLESSAVMAVPLRSGGGTRFKILQAFASGLPVVATTIGAEGLDVEHGRHLMIADDPQAFIKAVQRLLDDPEAGKAMANAAQNLVEEKYLWSTITPRCDAAFTELQQNGICGR